MVIDVQGRTDGAGRFRLEYSHASRGVQMSVASANRETRSGPPDGARYAGKVGPLRSFHLWALSGKAATHQIAVLRTREDRKPPQHPNSGQGLSRGTPVKFGRIGGNNPSERRALSIEVTSRVGARGLGIAGASEALLPGPSQVGKNIRLVFDLVDCGVEGDLSQTPSARLARFCGANDVLNDTTCLPSAGIGRDGCTDESRTNQ